MSSLLRTIARNVERSTFTRKDRILSSRISKAARNEGLTKRAFIEKYKKKESK